LASYWWAESRNLHVPSFTCVLCIWFKPGFKLHILPFIDKKEQWSWVLVAYAYNPSYWGGRDQVDHNLRPAQANSSWDPVPKIPNTKKNWWTGLNSRAPA
jgi:hypothetical protein